MIATRRERCGARLVIPMAGTAAHAWISCNSRSVGLQMSPSVGNVEMVVAFGFAFVFGFALGFGFGCTNTRRHSARSWTHAVAEGIKVTAGCFFAARLDELFFVLRADRYARWPMTGSELDQRQERQRLERTVQAQPRSRTHRAGCAPARCGTGLGTLAGRDRPGAAARRSAALPPSSRARRG